MSEIYRLPKIPGFTREDFLSSTAPYEWLYQFAEKPFELEQLKAGMASAAQALKVRNFASIWNRYCEAENRKRGVVIDAVTAFTGQSLELKCGAYTCDDHGIFGQGRFDGMPEEILSHPLMPLQRLVNIDTEEMRMMISYRLGGLWRKTVESKTTLASAQKIVSLARLGIAVTSENAKEVVRYLSAMEAMNYDALPEQMSVGRLGWLPGMEGFSPYCDDVVYDGDSGELKRMFSAIAPCGDMERWMDAAKGVRARSAIPPRVALAASFAAPLLAPLGVSPFILHLWGGSGAGKSVALRLAASVWGENRVNGDYIQPLSSTKVGMAEIAAFCHNIPVCLDELQTIKDNKQYDDIIYMLCEGKDKPRGARDGGLRDGKRWHTCAITTGEDGIVKGNSGTGATMRVLEVNYQEAKLFADAPALCEVLDKHYGHAGKMWVDALKDPDSIERAKQLYKEYSDSLGAKYAVKLTHTAAVLLAADVLATEVLFRDGRALAMADLEPYMITQDNANINKRCYGWLLEHIAANPVRFRQADNPGELWGTVDDHSVCVIGSVFDRILADNGYNAQSFLGWADKQQLLIRGDGKNLKRRVRLGGMLTRCVCLKIQDDAQEFIDVSGEQLPF